MKIVFFKKKSIQLFLPLTRWRLVDWVPLPWQCRPSPSAVGVAPEAVRLEAVPLAGGRRGRAVLRRERHVVVVAAAAAVTSPAAAIAARGVVPEKQKRGFKVVLIFFGNIPHLEGHGCGAVQGLFW